MKKFYILTSLTIFFNTAFAQKNTFELRAGAGYLSDSHCAEVFANSVGFFILVFFGEKDFKIATSGVYSGEFLWRLNNKHLQAGMCYSYEKLKSVIYYNNSSTESIRCIKTFMPCLYYNYLITPKSSFYSGLSLGVKTSMYPENKTTKTKFAYHFTSIGLRYGKQIAAFGEVGFGAKGILRGGVAISF